MISHNPNTDSYLIDDSFRAGLEHSFFRHIQENISKENNFEGEDNFTLDDDEAKSIKREDFNDHPKNKENIISNLLSTKSSFKEDPQNLALQKLQGSNSHVFFSGYFGEKKEDARQEGFNSSHRYAPLLTNPFAFNEADHQKKTFTSNRMGFNTNTNTNTNNNSHLEMINVNARIMNGNHSNFGNFNGSFISSSNLTSNSNLNRSSTSTTKINTNQNSFNDLVKSVSIANFSTSKPKKSKIYLNIILIKYVELLSTEDLMLEKIKKEKEEMHRLKLINKQNVEKVKCYVKQPVMPQPLTLIKPFNLSMNNSKLLMKKRVTNTNVDEINSKITETMKKKCEKVGDNLKEAVFAHEKIVLQKPEHSIRHMKKSLGRSISRSKSKSPIKSQNLDSNEDDVTSLTSRIEKYCVISGFKSANNNYSNVHSVSNKSKSPLKTCFSNRNDLQQNEDKFFNNQVSCILMNTSKTLTKSFSIRKHFNSNLISTEDKIVKEMQNYKFTPKPLNKNIFCKNNKKQNEIESIESIMMKTRMEKSEIEKIDKENKKMDKINQMKVNKLKKDTRGRENRFENKENLSSNLVDVNMILEL
jgi:hypothetical protein